MLILTRYDWAVLRQQKEESEGGWGPKPPRASERYSRRGGGGRGACFVSAGRNMSKYRTFSTDFLDSLAMMTCLGRSWNLLSARCEVRWHFGLFSFSAADFAATRPDVILGAWEAGDERLRHEKTNREERAGRGGHGVRTCGGSVASPGALDDRSSHV